MGQPKDDQATTLAMAQESIDRALPQTGPGPAPETLSPDVRDGADVDLAGLTAALEALGGLGWLAPRSTETPPQLGRFLILGERGSGGFGIVVRAFDPLLQREVALKIPRPDRLVAGHAPDEIVREAQVAARLEHPGIVRVYEASRLGPVWYIASAYCEGPTLGQWLAARGAPLEPLAAADLVADVAEAVHYAHARGVLHLDLKPDNILLERLDQQDQWRPLVTDFGLAGRCDEPAEASPPRVAGTMGYMAPEQLIGDCTQIGVTADVYALGAILCDLLGEACTVARLSGSDARHEGQGTSRDIPRAPRDLEAICRKCLALDPHLRYESAGALAADLRRFVRGDETAARPLPLPQRAWRWARRRPALASSLAACLAIAAGSLIAILSLWHDAQAHLALLQAEQHEHAGTSAQLRSSLLNYALVTLEGELRRSGRTEGPRDQLALLRQFLLEASRNSAESSGDALMQVALQAAQHSVLLATCSLADPAEIKLTSMRQGIAAWESIAAAEPGNSRWPRALAVHLMTFAQKEPDADWLWWHDPDNRWAPLPRATRSLAALPYAEILASHAQHCADSNPHVATDMFEAADVLTASLDDRFVSAPEVLKVQLAVHGGLARTKTIVGDSEAVAAQLALLRQRLRRAPAAAACPPLLARHVADGYRRLAQFEKQASGATGGLEHLTTATEYSERACGAALDLVPRRLEHAADLRRLSRTHANNGDQDAAEQLLVRAVSVLDEALALQRGHREALLRRAAFAWQLADMCLDRGDAEQAAPWLESATTDYATVGLCRTDAATDFGFAIRAWQFWGDWCAARGERDAAFASHQRALDLLESMPANRRNGVPFSYLYERGRNAQDQLRVSTTDAPL